MKEYVYFTVYIFVSIVIVCFHGATIYVAISSKELKKSRFLLLALFLSLSDLACGISIIYSAILGIIYLHQTMILYQCMLARRLAAATIISSIYQSFMISLERLNATFVHKKQFLTRLTSNKAVILAFFIIQISTSMIFGFETLEDPYPHGCSYKYTYTEEFVYLGDTFVIPLIFLTVVSCIMLIVRLKRRMKVRPWSDGKTNTTGSSSTSTQIFCSNLQTGSAAYQGDHSATFDRKSCQSDEADHSASYNRTPEKFTKDAPDRVSTNRRKAEKFSEETDHSVSEDQQGRNDVASDILRLPGQPTIDAGNVSIVPRSRKTRNAPTKGIEELGREPRLGVNNLKTSTAENNHRLCVNSSKKPTTESTKKLRKSIVTLGLFVVVLLLSYLPRLCGCIVVWIYGLEGTPGGLLQFGNFCLSITPLLDPIIYIMRLPQYRKIILKKFCCCKQ